MCGLASISLHSSIDHVSHNMVFVFGNEAFDKLTVNVVD